MQLIRHFKRTFIAVLIIFYNVSGFAQTCNDRVALVAPNNRFEVSDNEVKDLKTGLVWQRCSVGQVWDGSTCVGSPSKYNWAEALALTDAQWRLPNIKELFSIVETSCYQPAINAAVFPNTASDKYWSSSKDHQSTVSSLGVVFDEGNGQDSAIGNHRSNYEYVRLVRVDSRSSISGLITN